MFMDSAGIRRVVFAVVVLNLLGLFAGLASAHETGGAGSDEGGVVSATDANGGVMLDETIRRNTLQLVLAGVAIVTTLTGVAAFLRRKGRNGKARELQPLLSYALFFLIAATILGVTGYVAGSTVYLNSVSVAKGPVHWHADFEAWDCGHKLDLISPKGMSNEVGTPVVHSHGDGRIHIEGVIVQHSDASLGRFFTAVGGDLHSGLLRFPTDSGMAVVKDGDACNGGAGTLQVFVYKTVNGLALQEKVPNYESYVISPHSQIPPGDCVILEFDSKVKLRTEHVCESYNVAMKKGAVNGG